ncbi:ornithine cyclodeaminase [Algoriphagus machipongonensis]|uniref:Ornithine cyclodeaminase n=2 Tax=Algoriphagus machipongonensis TaxID=388413 RepID=A3HYQ6_9BACT|nr:ornithine cyclodeaminase [Algoriphagus machipongonensis]
MMNATELTARRTACTSALAASFLARKDAENLLVVGGGKVAQHLVQAHFTVRKFKKSKRLDAESIYLIKKNIELPTSPKTQITPIIIG